MENLLKKFVNQTWTATPEVIDQCLQFTEDVISSCNYNRRGQSNPAKVKTQIFQGKVAEFGVSKLMQARFLDVSDPDLKIYQRKEKSFDADLKWDLEKIHVKTQDSMSLKRYGEGWMFQKNDPIILNPTSHDWVALTSFDIKTKATKVINFLGAGVLLTEEPKVFQLRNNKLVVLPKGKKMNNRISFFLCRNQFEIGSIMDVRMITSDQIINIETLAPEKSGDGRNIKVWYSLRSDAEIDFNQELSK